MSSIEDEKEDRRTVWTLGAIKERNLELEGYCQTQGCGHFYVFNVENLISGIWRGLRGPGAVCKECGGDLKFKLALGSPEDLTPLLGGGRSVPTAQRIPIIGA